MASGIYKTRDGETVQVINQGGGHYLIRYSDGRVTVI